MSAQLLVERTECSVLAAGVFGDQLHEIASNDAGRVRGTLHTILNSRFHAHVRKRIAQHLPSRDAVRICELQRDLHTRCHCKYHRPFLIKLDDTTGLLHQQFVNRQDIVVHFICRGVWTAINKPSRSARSLHCRSKRRRQIRIVQTAIVLQSLNSEEIGIVLKPVQNINRCFIKFRRPRNTCKTGTLHFQFTILLDNLVKIRLPVWKVGVQAGAAVFVEITVRRNLAGVLNDREERGLHQPVALLDLAENLCGLQRREEHIDNRRINERGQPLRDTGVRVRRKLGLSVHRQIEVALPSIFGEGVIRAEKVSALLSQCCEIGMHVRVTP